MAITIWTWCSKCHGRTDWEETSRDSVYIYYKCVTPGCNEVRKLRISGGSLRERLTVAFGVVPE
jgi:hypothetical protein